MDREFYLVFRSLWPENRYALSVCFFTGLPLTVVLGLRPSELVGNYIFHAGVRYWLPFRLAAALRRIQSLYYLFPHRDYADRHRTRQAVYKDLLRAKRELGLPAARITPLLCSLMAEPLH